MAAKKRTLWATTAIGSIPVLIYTAKVREAIGLTIVGDDGSIEIVIREGITPQAFDSTLLHEFFHVIDLQFELGLDDDNDSFRPGHHNICALEQGLSQLLANLRHAEAENKDNEKETKNQKAIKDEIKEELILSYLEA